MMRLGFDLDEVVFNFIDPFLEFVNKKYGTNYTRKHMTEYSFEASGVIPKGSNDTLVNEFGRSGGFRNLPLNPGAKEIIELLRLKGHDIIYITSRNPEFTEDTKISLVNNGLTEDVIFSGHLKTPYISGQKLDLFVDDSPKNVNDIIEHVPSCASILFTNIPGSIRDAKCHLHVKSWIDVYMALVKIKTMTTKISEG